MNCCKYRVLALFMALVTLSGALLLTSASLAAPQKKKPPVKKKETPKKNDLVAAGKKVYDSSGCANCHAISGKGGMSAPELTKIGADPKHDAKWMETAVTNPKGIDPDSTMPAFDKIKGKDLQAIVAYLRSLK